MTLRASSETECSRTMTAHGRAASPNPGRCLHARQRTFPVSLLPPFPASRPRRLRRDAFTRALVREHRLGASDLIYPVFVLEGEGRSQDVASMPGVQRLSVDRLFARAEACIELGVPLMALFPV